jgi:hypothetical protein
VVHKSSSLANKNGGVISLDGLTGAITLVAGSGFPYTITVVGQTIVFGSTSPSGNYVAEDGVSSYVAENGTDNYVTEN